MKKLLGIVVLGLMWCNVGFADEKPKISYNSVNENIIKYGWKIKSIKSFSEMEIYTLTKGKWIMKCRITYHLSNIFTWCVLP